MIFDEDRCMHNSYLLVTGKRKLEDFLKNQEDVYFIHNPDEPLWKENDHIYDVLIDHFIYTEEYEKCQELVELKAINGMFFLN
tara:strand:- start:190 stop:438 length:249 start_codon:yes stop_codon:yes gene_type:complete